LLNLQPAMLPVQKMTWVQSWWCLDAMEPKLIAFNSPVNLSIYFPEKITYFYHEALMCRGGRGDRQVIGAENPSQHIPAARSPDHSQNHCR
jgi:hypothetical protein